MTRGAVFKDTESKIKKVVVSGRITPKAAFLDPRLLETLPTKVTASTGADALTQAIEGFLSRFATPWTDALHLHAIRLIRPNYLRAVESSKDHEAMGAMQIGAALAGAGLAYSGVGAAHAIANTVGGKFPVPHGIACAIMLPQVLQHNARHVPERFRVIASNLQLETVGKSDGDVISLVYDDVSQLLEKADVSWKLREFGVDENSLSEIAIDAAAHSDMDANPVKIESSDILTMIKNVY
jgi:alcohol dehydrogenase class IV